MDDKIPHPDLYRIPFTSDEWHGMPYRTTGCSGLRTSLIGIGTWKFGLPETGDGARVDEKTAFAIFDRAIELGVTFWDTANRYNDASGNAERVIGRWLQANPDQRRNVIVCTKVYGAMDDTSPNHSRLARQNILDSLYASLRRMQIDYVDMLYFHLYDKDTPIDESLAAIEDLVQRDLVRYFAVSNFTVDQLKFYQAVEKRLSPRCRAVAVQNRLDILRGEQPDKQGVLRFCAANGVAFVPYSPLAGGLLSDRYLDLSKVGQGDRLFDEGTLGKLAEQAVITRQQALAALAHEWGMELSQLALAYMLTLPGMGSLIPSASTVKQLESNAQAGKITLSDEQKNQVRAIVGMLQENGS